MLTSPDELAGEPQTLVIDLRPAEEFAVSRIPGAVHLDLWA